MSRFIMHCSWAGQTTQSRRRATTKEEKDLLATLEHLLVVGNQYRHEDWRLRTWKKREYDEYCKAEKQQESASTAEATASTLKNDDSDSDESESSVDISLDPNLLLHPKDTRQYGRNGKQAAEPWPKRTKLERIQSTVSDQNWEIECSDGTNPLHLYQARLSAHLPSTDSLKTESPGESIPKADSEKSHLEAPRSLLLRCWERAIHAASTAILVPTIIANASSDHSENLETSSARGSEVETPTTASRYTRSNAESFCQSLHLYPFNGTTAASFVCPVCSRNCETSEQLRDHFLGSNEYRGCCWILIDTKQRSILDSILVSEAENQINGLMELVVEKSQADTRQMNEIDTTRRLINWRHILGMLTEQVVRSKLNASPPTNAATLEHGEVVETLQIGPDEPSLLLNKFVLQAVTRRLVQRYGMLPR